MSVKIERKISHREWDQANLTPKQFIVFDSLYHSKNHGDDGLSERYNLFPTFIFDKGSVYVDESWGIDKEDRVSTSSYSCGVMSYSDKSGQYIESVYGREKELGQLIAIEFTVDDDMLEVFNKLSNVDVSIKESNETK